MVDLGKSVSVSEWQDWFVRVNNPTIFEMLKNEPTYFAANILYLFMAFMSLKFALSHGFNSR